MSAVDNISRIINNRNLASYPFKYCLVDKNKIPYTIEGKRARPNQINDFSLLEDVIMADIDLSLYKGVGISIQGSNISAIDEKHSIVNNETCSPSIDKSSNFNISLANFLTFCSLVKLKNTNNFLFSVCSASS